MTIKKRTAAIPNILIRYGARDTGLISETIKLLGIGIVIGIL